MGLFAFCRFLSGAHEVALLSFIDLPMISPIINGKLIQSW